MRVRRQQNQSTTKCISCCHTPFLAWFQTHERLLVRRSNSLDLLLQLPQRTVGPAQLGPKVLSARRTTSGPALRIPLLLPILLVPIWVPRVLGVPTARLAILRLRGCLAILRLRGRSGVILLCVRVAASGLADDAVGGRVGGLGVGLVPVGQYKAERSCRRGSSLPVVAGLKGQRVHSWSHSTKETHHTGQTISRHIELDERSGIGKKVVKVRCSQLLVRFPLVQPCWKVETGTEKARFGFRVRDCDIDEMMVLVVKMLMTVRRETF